MSIGDNIRKRRFELKMTQQELAVQMGYKSRSTIAKIESGENDITQTKLQKLAYALSTTAEQLMNGEENFVSRENLRSDSGNIDSGERNKNIAVILAGGKSGRNQQNIPNQFMTVLGKPIIIYSMNAYETHPLIDDIYVVCLKGWESIVKAYAKQFHITKLRGIIPAASTGVLSFKNSAEVLMDRYDEADLVLFQESTRPLVTEEMISKIIQTAETFGNATTCRNMSDYLQFTINDIAIQQVNREKTVEAQSPDAYQFKVLKEIIHLARKKKHSYTETCSSMLLSHLGYPIHFVEGSINNPKIIRQEDIAIIEALIKKR